MTNVRINPLRKDRQTVISESEFQDALARASKFSNAFLRLRARAILSVLRAFGKRRGEIALLPLSNLKVEKSDLEITFILLKKRKETVLQKLAKKSLPLDDPLAKPILEYLQFLDGLEIKPKFFLPRAKSVFGNITILPDFHISGRQVFNVVRACSETIWPHLFRETVASDIIKQDSSIISAFKVQRRLDLEDFKTGFNYLKRYAVDRIQREEAKT